MLFTIIILSILSLTLAFMCYRERRMAESENFDLNATIEYQLHRERVLESQVESLRATIDQMMDEYDALRKKSEQIYEKAKHAHRKANQAEHSTKHYCNLYHVTQRELEEIRDDYESLSKDADTHFRFKLVTANNFFDEQAEIAIAWKRKFRALSKQHASAVCNKITAREAMEAERTFENCDGDPFRVKTWTWNGRRRRF